VARERAARGRAKDPEPGERWRFTGQARDGRMLISGAWQLVPSGRALIEYLAANPRFAGVGRASIEASSRITDRIATDALKLAARRKLRVIDRELIARVMGDADYEDD